MARSRFTEEQIVAILKESSSGVATSELCRRNHVSEQTFYRWKRRYGSDRLTSSRRIKQLEDENADLKRLVAEKELQIHSLKRGKGLRSR